MPRPARRDDYATPPLIPWDPGSFMALEESEQSAHLENEVVRGGWEMQHDDSLTRVRIEGRQEVCRGRLVRAPF